MKVKSVSSKIIRPLLALLALSLLAGGPRSVSATTIIVHERLFYALTDTNKILTFDIHTPGTIDRTVSITGLQSGESILAIDVRPSTGQLYGLGSTSRLYRLNPLTGAAQQVGSAPFSPSLGGDDFGFDFDPAGGVIRVVSDDEQNLRLNPDTGAAAADPPLAYATGDANAGANPNVVALNYVTITDEHGTSSTALYGVDTDLDTAVVIDNPATGTLRTLGPLGTDAPEDVGFANAQGTGLPFALMKEAGEQRPVMYLLHLLSNFPEMPARAVRLSPINTTETIRGLAVGRLSGTFQFAQAEHRVVEEATSVRVVVTRTGDISQAASVDYILRCDPNALVRCEADRQASRLSDFTDRVGTLFFAPNVTSRSFAVLVNEDSIVEGPEGETVVFTLMNPTGNFGVTTPLISKLVIEDDDAPGAANVIDDARSFVHQHYHDFFGREPDAAGLAFWVAQIESCGADTACVDARRQNVSAAFFHSREFQETGFVAYLTHHAAFATGERLSLHDFLADQGLLSDGVIDGEAGSEAKLEANKRFFFDAFVSRPRFLAAYPPSLTPAEFVAALDARAGGALNAQEREHLANLLSTGATTRAEVLRAIAEDADVREREKRRAFVLMQYMGYLRRAPNESPNTDFSGFNFWLQKLNDHGGNFVAAQMVRSFLVSGEYRGRFGQ
ncbi:MAG TPA: DUF4394 domain-containing protein [Pyrinomonadaceae bacterium]|nr:DUF4394 domain-containing protein [Pyrinomonadaceae bacterium]